ncbi:hypothetical protein [Gordonibacter sp.]|uniref:hypothetical protein n=1 Tax=Gordonibacter sp. TaxID=1968902 RepID=UPI002FC5A8FC
MTGFAPSYDWYEINYPYAKLDQAAFEAVLVDAEARVDERVRHRDLATMPDDEITAYRRAICAACEALDDPAVTSYSAGEVSESLVDASSQAVGRVIDRTLSQTKCLRLYGAWL